MQAVRMFHVFPPFQTAAYGKLHSGTALYRKEVGEQNFLYDKEIVTNNLQSSQS